MRAYTQELYSKIVAGKVQGRSFAFNDDGYKDMRVADEWRGFAGKFLPEPSPYETNLPPPGTAPPEIDGGADR